MLKVWNLKCEHMTSPLGISLRNPVLSWESESTENNMLQSAYRVIVSDDPEEIRKGEGTFYDTGKKASGENLCKLGRILMKSAARYYWAVKIWNQKGEESPWSAPAEFETGLLYAKDWTAKWVEPYQRPVCRDGITRRTPGSRSGSSQVLREYLKPVDEHLFNPCPMLRKEFQVNSRVKRARLYATAHGIYSLELNGKRLGDLQLMPEVTPYRKMLQVQTYDITDLLEENNCIGAILADGWWAGRLSVFGTSCEYGDMLGLLLQINIEYEDGTIGKIGTDGTFRSMEGPWRYADLTVGEKYDARLLQEGWSRPGFDDSCWQDVQTKDYPLDNLVGQNAEPIRAYEIIRPKAILTSPKGETIIDFGQCFSGYARFRLRGTAGHAVEFHHTQMLDKDGNFWSDIMGLSKQMRDTYVFRGDGEETFEPRFTYRGFRYIWVKDYEGTLTTTDVEGVAIASGFAETGFFRCSDDRVNRLESCIRYSILSNYIAIPTDDCDRERAGWTGDAQIMSATTNFLFDLSAFWKRWLAEFRAEQHADGRVDCIIPAWKSMQMGFYANCWGDACIILPWEAYMASGDEDLLADNYEMMQKWMDYCLTSARERNPKKIGELTPERAERLKYLRNADFQFGDWLTPSANYDENGNYVYFVTPLKELVPAYFMTYCAELMSRIAGILGREDDAAFYEGISEKIRRAAIGEYYDSGYIMNSKLQGASIMALKGRLYTDGEEQALKDRLLELLKLHDGMDVGFASAPLISTVLTEAGCQKEAYDLLLDDRIGSWLYMVKKGATTLWEEFNAVAENGDLKPVSYDLPTFGCIGAWLYRTVAGINAAEAGYKKIRIAPVLDPERRITWAEASRKTPYGLVSSHWEIAGGRMKLSVTIPANATAEIILPDLCDPAGVEVNGIVTDVSGGITVGSGTYCFEYRKKEEAA